MAYIIPEQARQRFIPRRAPGQGAPAGDVITFDRAIGKNQLLYVINNETTGKSYLSPADDKLGPVLGEWDTDEDMEDLPPDMLWWLGIYESEIKWWQNEGEILGGSGEDIDDEETGVVGRRRAASNPQQAEELILENTNKWNQHEPFNTKLIWGPRVTESTSYDHWRATGCGPLALAIVLRYFGKQGYYIGCKGIDGYTHYVDKEHPNANVDYTVTCNLPSRSNFDFSNMLDKYNSDDVSEKADAVSTLLQYTATSVKAYPAYTVTSKDKRSYTGGSSSVTANNYDALKNYFRVNVSGYNSDNNYASYGFPKLAWSKIIPKIVNSLKNGSPVVIGATDVSGKGGHGFVCSGYKYDAGDSVPYLYINWGWGGSKNGYFKADALDVTYSGTSYGFNTDRYVCLDIKPRYSKDNIDLATLVNTIKNIGKADADNIYDFDYSNTSPSSKTTLADAETLAGFFISDIDRTDASKKKAFKLASVVSINKSCREIISKLNKLGYK